MSFAAWLILDGATTTSTNHWQMQNSTASDAWTPSLSPRTRQIGQMLSSPYSARDAALGVFKSNLNMCTKVPLIVTPLHNSQCGCCIGEAMTRACAPASQEYLPVVWRPDMQV